jgi:exodeoxyribonuclease-5
MFIDIQEPKSIDNERFDAIIETEDGGIIPRNRCYSGHFVNHYEPDKDRESRDWKSKRYTIESTYGWAITCHKAQGSQWGNVIVYDDRWGRSSDQRRQWLYTAITRAESGLVILE